MKVASGIFQWDREERVNKRYGGFYMANENYESSAKVKPVVDEAALKKLWMKRVHITAKVIESRKSGHIGDLFIKVYPTQPEVGEIVDLGVGTLGTYKAVDGETAMVLRPGDGRRTLWIDPRKLYRVHDQTVEVYIEPTKADFTPAPDIEISTEAGAMGTGDGCFQTQYIPDEAIHTIVPPVKVTRLGGGLFVMEPKPVSLGEKLEIDPRRPKRAKSDKR